jgi:D-hexose-6-phosphate mutarotase
MSQDLLESLNGRFSLPGLAFINGKGGLPAVKIENQFCTALIALHGAHVLSYIPAGGMESIFVSKEAVFKEGVAVRGGIPVCWPWFGDHLSDADVYSHGFARRNNWTVTDAVVNSDKSHTVTFMLSGSAGEFPSWPYSFNAVLTVTAGQKLTVTLKSENTGRSAFTITNALHTYFNVSSIKDVDVEGLDGCSYQDDVDGEKIKKQEGLVKISKEVDRVYMNTGSDCIITDPGFKRRIIISKSGSETTVVWNPWADNAAGMKDMADDEYKKMLCIEAVNTFDDAREILPGQSHSISQTIEIRNI